MDVAVILLSSLVIVPATRKYDVSSLIDGAVMLVDTPSLMEADAEIEADTDAANFAEDASIVINAVQEIFMLCALMDPVPSIVTFCDASRSVVLRCWREPCTTA